MRLIQAALVFPVGAEPIRNGAIVVDGDLILDVGEASLLATKYPDAAVEEYPRHALLPGLVNAHTHLELTGYPRRGYTERSSYSQWLLEQNRYKSEVPKAFIRDAMSHGIDELVAAGTTTVGDMQSDVHATGGKLWSDKGIRAVIFPEISSFERESGQERYEQALAAIEAGAPSPLVTAGLGPYAAYILSRQLLKISAHHARAASLPIQIHAAETFHEMEFFFDSKGDLAENLFPQVGWGEELPPPHLRTPIAYLHQIGFLAAKPAIVGAVHLAPSDIEILAKSGSKLVHCPRANAYFLQGLTPIRACLQAGIPVGLGTEGHASVETLSLWDDMRVSLALHRHGGAPLSPDEVLRMATLGGAQVLGLDAEIGSIAPGKKADYIVVEWKHGLPEPDRLVEQLILQTYPEQVVRVAVNGKDI